MNQQSKVAVIGAGVMGEALIAALISSGVNSDRIAISEKREERAQELIAKYSIKVEELTSNVSKADAILLVVKPQDMGSVLEEIKGSISPEAVVITFAAGKTISFISNGLGTSNPVVRVMPNTPTLVGAGMAAASMGTGVTAAQRDFVLGFLGATGKVIEVSEDLQDAVTATSGSGPAYFFAFVEAMVDGAKELGLSHEDATTLTVQTIVGAAKLLDQSGKSATTLRENVTSPNGTTAAALASFASDEMNSMVAKAMKAARDRSQELA
ncbi:MAG: pyrroline-5-carboxylate reductase [Candidatus Planktophila sp.]|nr:pyrroline-5-carboxylate reductase [Candidatus Planktophila sp.]